MENVRWAPSAILVVMGFSAMIFARNDTNWNIGLVLVIVGLLLGSLIFLAQHFINKNELK